MVVSIIEGVESHLSELRTLLLELFEYTRKPFTDTDIRNFSPQDPGYEDYVECWNSILKTGIIPQKSHFDLSEVIGLTGLDLQANWPIQALMRTHSSLSSLF